MGESRSSLFKWLLGSLILAIVLTLVYVLLVRPAQRIKQLEAIPGVSVDTNSHIPWMPAPVRERFFRYVESIYGEVFTRRLPHLGNHRKLWNIWISSKPPQDIDLRGCVNLRIAYVEVLSKDSTVTLEGLPRLEDATVGTPGPWPIDLRFCPALTNVVANGPVRLVGCDALEHLAYTGRRPPPPEDWKSFTKLKHLTIQGNIDGELIENFPPLAYPERLESLYFPESIRASNVPWQSLTGLKTVYLDGRNTPANSISARARTYAKSTSITRWRARACHFPHRLSKST